MKLLIKNGRVIGTAEDNYYGNDVTFDAHIGFDINRISEYTEINGVVSIPSKTADEIWTLIKSYRDNLIQNGGYLASGKWFHSDTLSRTQQMGLVMMGASVPAVQWKTMDGTFITMTQTLAGQIFAAAAMQDQALFSHAELLHATVLAAEDPNSVDITAGWPSTYVSA